MALRVLRRLVLSLRTAYHGMGRVQACIVESRAEELSAGRGAVQRSAQVVEVDVQRTAWQLLAHSRQDGVDALVGWMPALIQLHVCQQGLRLQPHMHLYRPEHRIVHYAPWTRVKHWQSHSPHVLVTQRCAHVAVMQKDQSLPRFTSLARYVLCAKRTCTACWSCKGSAQMGPPIKKGAPVSLHCSPTGGPMPGVYLTLLPLCPLRPTRCRKNESHPWLCTPHAMTACH